MQINGEQLLGLIRDDITDSRRIGACESTMNLFEERGYVVTVVIQERGYHCEQYDLDETEPVNCDYMSPAIEQ